MANLLLTMGNLKQTRGKCIVTAGQRIFSVRLWVLTFMCFNWA